MDCPDENRIVDLLEGALTGDGAAELHAHAAACEACRKLLALLAEPAPGTQIGRYTVIERVGQGGMGVVYSARDPELERKVAIKLIRLDRGSYADATTRLRARLQNEAKAMARVQHENVVAVYELGAWRDQVFMAMEWIEGGTLTAWLAERARAPGEILAKLIAAGRGLAAAHAAGLVHRDFKPDNVLIGPDGRARVTDFGLALLERLIEESTGEEPGDLTATGAFVGTLRYIAPEQIRGEPVDARGDVFSFCVAAWEALHGVRPFAGRTAKELLEAVAAGPPAADRPRGISARAERALRAGLSGIPDERPADMDALLARLTPRPRWRVAVAASLGAAVLASTVAIAVGLSAGRRCADEGRLLGQVWDGSARARVRAAFGATRLPYADRAAATVVAELDAYTHAWTVARHAACEAHARGEEDEDTHALRAACLDAALGRVSALTRLFAEAAADPELVARAAGAVAALDPLDRCADTAALRAGTPLPRDPWLRARVQAAAAMLDSARAFYELGRHAQAVALADVLVPSAEAQAYPPLAAQAELVRGDALMELGRFPEAAAALKGAAAAALAAHLDDKAALAWIQLAWLDGFKQRRREQGEEWLSLAAAAVARAGDRPELRVKLERARTAMLLAAHQFAEAEVSARRTLELAERTYGRSAFEVAGALNQLASALSGGGHPEQALPLQQRALDVLVAEYGPDHPGVAVYRYNMSHSLERLGRFQEALAAAEEALAARRKLFPPDHPAVIDATTASGELLWITGRAEEGIARLEESLAAARKRSHKRGMVEALDSLARAHLAAGRIPEAAAALDELAAVDAKAAAEAQPAGSRGRVEEALGHRDAAIPLLEKALEGKASFDDPRLVGEVEQALARARRVP